MKNLKLKLELLLKEARQKNLQNEVIELELAIKELKELESKANTWDRVWERLKGHKLINLVRREHAKHGNCSAASILLDAYDRSYECYEELEDSE